MCHKIHGRFTNIITCFFFSFSQRITSLQLNKMHGYVLRTLTGVCSVAPHRVHDKANQRFQLAGKAKASFFPKYALAVSLQSAMAVILISCEKKIRLWTFRQILGKEMYLEEMFCISGEGGARGGKWSRACEEEKGGGKVFCDLVLYLITLLWFGW